MGYSENRDLSIQGMHIQTLYGELIKERFLINRKYQRKLAWSIEEKRNFIDTLINKLPIPLFLLAEVVYENETKLEVIDGMQRLDAIFSFIEQKYSLKDGFFDLSVMADTLSLMNSGKLEQKTPILDAETCRNIANYLIPISKSLSFNTNEIEETFRRINSNGRHLSSQELRQAGALGRFPQLIRKMSAEIRGDVSRENLMLNDMSKISLTNKRLEYYGLNIDEMFWVKNKIISSENIRASRDEEIIGHIIANMILLEKDNYTSRTLDQYYGFNSNPLGDTPLGKTKIENAIDRLSEDTIRKQFGTVYSFIDDLLIRNKLTFEQLIYKDYTNDDHYRAFQAMFMAFFNQIIKKNKQLIDEKGLLDELNGLGDELLHKKVIDQLYKESYQERVVNSIIGRIQNYFKENPVSDPAFDDWTKEFTNILMYSNTEQNQYDFKLGVYDLHTGKLNVKLIEKIVKTLSAINNLGPNKVGYVIIGVADKFKDAETYCAKYDTEYVSKHDFYITGINAEANVKCSSLDRYIHQIKEKIKTAPVEPKDYLNHILTTLKSRKYYGKEILILQTNYGEPVWYDGELYERHGSDISKVNKSENLKIYKRFSQI